MPEDKTCFVIMPFGEKLDLGNQRIDFDVIYKRLIKPPLDNLHLKVIRSDEIPNPGSVHRGMLQHILNDDVAVVDITTLNPNVFYELGVRHALRKGITVLLRKKGTTTPFNIHGMRTIEYDVDLEGAEIAREELQRSVQYALENPANDSLVYEIFPDLAVPDTGK